jgi:hypothetical protein
MPDILDHKLAKHGRIVDIKEMVGLGFDIFVL